MAQSRMERTPKKRKKHGFLKFIIGLIIVLAILATGFYFAERYVVKQATDKIVNHLEASNNLEGATTGSVPAANPEQLAGKLNELSQSIIDRSAGLLDSAQASVNGSTLTYNLSSSKLNNVTAAAVASANADSMKTIADKALEAMRQAGTQNPKVQINLTDASGNTIKTLSYQ
ncbi:hypothetical protein [Lactococcus termiticola]|uniref:Uncharacterized protein n=1 Tax=Lactococcus termiticola TaxID=2169526 RepID=A0A2R5HEQ6_9LACT|nr:hypothetical protein [Lactococcus termiticola]GBG96533.1 hypothetical protein NtB2_00646 [Lactococcus termiticola]